MLRSLNLRDRTRLIEASAKLDVPIHIWEWPIWARPDQLEPEGDWRLWLLLGGRGAGKTRTGAEWIRAKIRSGARHIGLVAPTLSDAREVMLDGESGLLALGFISERPDFIASRRRLEWPNGAVGHIFSAEDPDSLRGAQFDAAWADEFCAWRYPDETLSNLQLGLRLGDNPRLVMTTTPRPIAALDDLIAAPDTVVSRAKTQDNAAFLAPGFIRAMQKTYGGTALGRQELDGEIIREVPGALWNYDLISRQRVDEECIRNGQVEIERILVAIDPPTTSGPRADACGLIVAGRAGDCAYILEDASVQGLAPDLWAARAVALYHQYQADCLLAEVNQGGEMVSTIIRQIDADVPVRTVHASRAKAARAEPVASLYGQGRVFHVGVFTELEAEMVRMSVGPRPVQNLPGSAARHSPDRTDAMVWAVHELLLRHKAAPRIRHL